MMISNSPNSSSASIVTDYDYIINLGYKQDDVSRVLKLTNGDRNAAIYILDKEYYTNIENNRQYIKNKQLREYSSWRKEMPDDWMDNVGKYNQPNIAINRALHKTPIYLQIESYERDLKQNCNYLVDIILKDGRHWKMIRRYSDFCRLKESLPLGTCSKFTNHFPHYAIFSLVITKMSDEFAEKRILLLNEWIRELVLNEQCMTNDKILDNIYKFIQIEKYGGKVGLNTTMVLKLNSHNRESFSKYNKELERKNIYFNNLKDLPSHYLPLSIETIRQTLPFKINIKTLPLTKHNTNNNSIAINSKLIALPIFNMHQLNKDYSRDRLIIQGNRIQGSHSDLDTILKVSKESIEEIILIAKKSLRYSPLCDNISHTNNTNNNIQSVVIKSPKNPFDDDFMDDNNDHSVSSIVNEGELSNAINTSIEDMIPLQNESHGVINIDEVGFTINEISLYALHLASRTESAFTSYSSLTQMLDIANTRQVTNFIPFLVTPESDLANSLHINYSLINRNQQWCIECQIEGSTVYRIVDDIDMKPLLQLQVTYIANFICIPMISSMSNHIDIIDVDNDNRSTVHNTSTTFSVLEGSRSLAIEQSTASTAHDWDTNKHHH